MKLSRKVRNDFASCSTGSKRGAYYQTIGHAIQAFDAVLHGFDLYFDPCRLYGFEHREGRKLVDVCNSEDDCIGQALVTWFRMASGNYEFVAYLV